MCGFEDFGAPVGISWAVSQQKAVDVSFASSRSMKPCSMYLATKLAQLKTPSCKPLKNAKTCGE